MTKRPDTNESVRLSLELLRHIPRVGWTTAADLHRKLAAAGIERDLRSVQRQLDALCKFMDIERDTRSKPYGYRWLTNSKGLALPHLTPSESLLLRLAEEHLRNLLPARLMKSMDDFFLQARRNLGTGDNTTLEREWLAKVRTVSTTQPLLPPKIVPEVFATVSEALYGNLWLHLEYINAGGKAVKADVMPLGLVQQGPRMYLVCRFQGYDDTRHLALHRFKSATASTLRFDRPKDFDLKQYDNDGKFGFGEGARVKLSFTIKPEIGKHLLETPLSTDQTVKVQKDGSLRITATVVESLMLTQWLRGFGDDVSRTKKKGLP